MVSKKEFLSLEEVNSFISEYEKKNLTSLFKRRSTLLESNRVKQYTPQVYAKANKELKYQFIKYCSMKGGSKYNYLGNNKRKSSTTKEACPVHLTFNLSEDGQKLVLGNLHEKHNHDVDEIIFTHSSKQRRLEPLGKKEVNQLMGLKCNKKLLQSYCKDKFGKMVTLRDLSNIKTASMKESDINLEEVVLSLKQDNPENLVELIINDNKQLEGIYFQDVVMRKKFYYFPDLLLLDATYCLNNLNMPLYILMTMNGNGKGEIVGLFLLRSETIENIRRMLQFFKENNSDWWKVKTVITDKDFKERRCLQELFPRANLTLCLFHVLKAFRSSITCDKMNITNIQRTEVLKVLSNLAYSRSIRQYNEHYDKLIKLNAPKVHKYYNDNWHSLKEEWVLGLKPDAFLVNTTNIVESTNKTIKTVISRNSNLTSFFKDLLCTINSIRTERRNEAMHIKTHTVYTAAEGITLKKYRSKLTPFAFDIVKRQYELSYRECKESYSTSKLKCDCLVFTRYTLPCRHIFTKRSITKDDLFDEDLIPTRYCKETLYKCELESFGIVNEVQEASTSNQDVDSVPNEWIKSAVTVINAKPIKALSKQQKFRLAMDQFTKIAEDLSEYGTSSFKKAMEYFTEISEKVSLRQELVINRNTASDKDVHSIIHDVAGASVGQKETLFQEETGYLSSIPEKNELLVCQEVSSSTIPEKDYNLISSEHDYCKKMPCGPVTVPLKDVKIMKRMKRVGRPKGVDSTVIGLPRKKFKK